MIIATSGSARPYLKRPQLRAPHAVLAFRNETTKGLQGGLACGPTGDLTRASEGATGELQGNYKGSYRGKTLATPCPDQPDPSQGLSPSSGPPPVTGKNAMVRRWPQSLESLPVPPISCLPSLLFLAFCSRHQTCNARLGQTSLHNSDCISNSLLFTHARIEDTQSDETVSSSFVGLLDTGSLKLPSIDDDNKRRTSLCRFSIRGPIYKVCAVQVTTMNPLN
ncbi:hypothetical protein E4U59_004991 [Claviceps monticola]|nr:hypothetical protein E4U59_004991 [Claviceps monticola]